MMRHKNFACFILTHGRPNKQKTLATLKRQGYTGDVYMIVDNEDPMLCEYQKKYKNIVIFDKDEAAKITDKGDIIQKKNTVLFARNMCHSIAKDLGLTYFLELDDDYNNIRLRYVEGSKLRANMSIPLEPVFDAYLDLLDKTGALCVCMSQSGDLMGGASCFYNTCKRISRKAMNAYFCRTDRPYKFVGRMNDDVNTYLTLGNKGHLLLTFGEVSINQQDTQQSKGGLTDMYLENGTYMKSFYSVMMAPAAVKIGLMGTGHKRIHHHIDWDHCAPKILREEYAACLNQEKS